MASYDRGENEGGCEDVKEGRQHFKLRNSNSNGDVGLGRDLGGILESIIHWRGLDPYHDWSTQAIQCGVGFLNESSVLQLLICNAQPVHMPEHVLWITLFKPCTRPPTHTVIMLSKSNR